MSHPPEYAAAALRSTPAQMTAGISVDLVVAAQREANFLRMIDRKAPLLYEPDVVNQAIRRYETCWLPMQAAHPDMNVIPPLDVHWIWHTHMLSPINYQEVSLPHYTSTKFLSEAVKRYIQFLLLKQTYSDQFLTPCYDFDIVWHTHQVHPLNYLRDCTAIFGSLLKHDDTVNDRTKGSKLLKGEALTKKLWATHFDEPFWRRGCMFRGHNAPVFLGFENQDLSNIAYGDVHVPSIALKDIPVQRDQLRLKLVYGNKKVTTFNADLSQKQVTKSGFSLVWQPTDASTSASIVKFPFERKASKDLLVELEIFDKMFLQRKDVIRLVGKASLDQLLPPMNSKSAHNVAEVCLRSKDIDKEMTAKVTVTTSVTLNRELQLIAGDFMEHQLQSDSHLSYLCQCASLNRSALTPSTTIHIATHSVVDTRDGAKYTVQVAHSAALLLSMILVYGREQRLLVMAHLIGADSLPSRDQLDNNLQFLPHISNADERAFVIVNKDGDYAILKGRWTGFSRKQASSQWFISPATKGQKAKPGSAGHLLIDVFNLLKNTVQKIEVPTPEGSTLFVIGDAQARLPGKRIECRSTNTAEQIASVFCVATLFVLCNPDKIRSRNDGTSIGHQAHKWPLTLACGYGRQLPSNRILQSHGANGKCMLL
ncbi:unnamed protein product [Angiostrongylus costaricensis]|uniref:VWFD domain-containing protein n=1 Tax=Angiostrongylus costaricensis TaxID=334426 RepID=A0A158PIX3_ANGCS|nr:unnamed protein product [Angiostrongylus costaricensis]